ncbi:hypothetical protein ACFOWM_13915 [Ferruginibacter yonginensis]|uniref:Uncharacterized protein n=1 Tax=Ferruginibacter yonginensis TaxID=1310416 RepID=A0ABV8QUX8_9BACT
MGYKAVCIDCRKTINRTLDFGSERKYTCSVCGKPMTLLSHLFKPPKKTDTKHLETVKYLTDNGFTYQHIYKTVEKSNGVIISYEGYVSYPDNLKEAKEFAEKYKDQLPNLTTRKASS